MSKVNLIVRTDMQADDTQMLTVYDFTAGTLNYIGYAYMRNHDVSVSALAIDMYISKYSTTDNVEDFIVNRV